MRASLLPRLAWFAGMRRSHPLSIPLLFGMSQAASGQELVLQRSRLSNIDSIATRLPTHRLSVIRGGLTIGSQPELSASQPGERE